MAGFIQVEPISAPPVVRPGRSRPSLRGSTVTIAALVLASAAYAAFRVFTGVSFYDDEGSLLLMSRWMREGHPVYRDFQSIYGPFYFLYQWIAHAWGGVSHTSGRIAAIIPWVSTSVLAFAYTLRLTRSRAVALLAWVAVLRTLMFIAAEPGHPQEVAIGLVMALLALFSTRTPRPWQLVCAGAIVAAITLTKINLGLYTGAAVLLALLAATPSQWAFRAMAGICVVAPACVMALSLDETWTRECCALLTVAIGFAVAAIAIERPATIMDAARWRALIAGFAACAVVLIGWASLQGGSLGSMLESIVLSNARGAHTWTVPMHIGVSGLLSGAASAVLFVLHRRGRKDVVAWCKLIAGGVALALIVTNQIEVAFALALPLMWLTSGAWPRTVLALVSVMLGLSIYPVAASQLRFALVPVAISATLWIDDALRAIRLPRARTAIVAFTAAVYAFSLIGSVRTYFSLLPLDLPGAAGVRVDADDRNLYQWVAGRVAQCDRFIAFPAMHSFYLWTGKLPPVYPDIDGWQPYLNAERQRVERSVLESPRACVVMIDKLVPFWLPAEDTARRTLLGYIRDRFVEVDRRDGIHILTRR